MASGGGWGGNWGGWDSGWSGGGWGSSGWGSSGWGSGWGRRRAHRSGSCPPTGEGRRANAGAGGRAGGSGAAAPTPRAAPTAAGARPSGANDSAASRRLLSTGILRVTVLVPGLNQPPQRTEEQVARIGKTWTHSLASNQDVSPQMSSHSDSSKDSVAFEQDVCGICLEKFEPGNKLTAMPCSAQGCPSVWHTECIRKWLCQANELSCPLCRAGIVEDHLERGASNPRDAAGAQPPLALTLEVHTVIPTQRLGAPAPQLSQEDLQELLVLAMLPNGPAQHAITDRLRTTNTGLLSSGLLGLSSSAVVSAGPGYVFMSMGGNGQTGPTPVTPGERRNRQMVQFAWDHSNQQQQPPQPHALLRESRRSSGSSNFSSRNPLQEDPAVTDGPILWASAAQTASPRPAAQAQRESATGHSSFYQAVRSDAVRTAQDSSPSGRMVPMPFDMGSLAPSGGGALRAHRQAASARDSFGVPAGSPASSQPAAAVAPQLPVSALGGPAAAAPALQPAFGGQGRLGDSAGQRPTGGDGYPQRHRRSRGGDRRFHATAPGQDWGSSAWLHYSPVSAQWSDEASSHVNRYHAAMPRTAPYGGGHGPNQSHSQMYGAGRSYGYSQAGSASSSWTSRGGPRGYASARGAGGWYSSNHQPRPAAPAPAAAFDPWHRSFPADAADFEDPMQWMSQVHRL